VVEDLKSEDKDKRAAAQKKFEDSKKQFTKFVTKDDLPRPPSSELDRLLTLPARDSAGKLIPPENLQFNGQDNGSMAAAFFERGKDKTYKKTMEDPAVSQDVKDKLKAERQAELDALVAWVRGADAPRKAAYETDSFEVPPALAGKVTSQFVKDGKVQIKSLIGARCAACHAPGEKLEDYALDTYEKLSNYLKPLTPDDGKGNGGAGSGPVPVPAPAPLPPKGVDPIPASKDD
jgi:hypothetical protein